MFLIRIFFSFEAPVTQESSANAAITSPTTRRDVDREEHLEDSDCDSDCTYVSL